MITISAGVAAAVFIVGGLVLIVLCTWLWVKVEDERYWYEASVELMDFRDGLNPYAHLLGKEVEAKVYAASNWERVIVIAVSWRGSVCVRPVRDMQTKGRWIHKDVAPMRVREVGNNDD